MKNEQSPIKEIWESIQNLLGIAFFGFLYAIGFLAFLGMFLQLTLGIDISESDNIHRLLFIFWGVCTLGWHFYLKNRRKKQELETQPQNKEEEFEVLVRLPQGVNEPQKKQSRHLAFLISTEGKTPEQISREGMVAFQKYERVKAQTALAPKGESE